MATKTSTAETGLSTTPKYLHTAPIYRIFRHQETLTLSAGDVVPMPYAQIPHGANIFDVRVGGGARDGTYVINAQITVGSTTTLLGSLTLTAAGRIPGPVVGPTTASEAANVPFIVSVSDDAALRYGTLQFTCSGATSATTSATVTIIVGYVMDK
jgi:hypothetical protein